MVVYSGITIQFRHYTIHISTTFYTNTPIATTYTHIIHIQLPTIHTIPYHPIQHPIPYYSTHYTHYYTPPPFPPLPAHATRLQTNHCLPVSGGQTASSPWSSWSPWSNSAFKPSETLAAWSVVRGPSIGCSPLIHSNSPQLTTHHSPRLTPPPPPPPPPKRNRSDLQQQNDNPKHLLLPKKIADVHLHSLLDWQASSILSNNLPNIPRLHPSFPVRVPPPNKTPADRRSHTN